jgi:tetratricopeptide (TPR) repeat protein
MTQSQNWAVGDGVAGLPYDVLLSYNRADQVEALQLADRLTARGLRPWIDVRDGVAGRLWQDELAAILESVPAAAVLIGPNGLGRWAEMEIRVLIDRSLNRRIGVLPVFLPSVKVKPRLPAFLSQYGWVDFGTEEVPVALDRLVVGIRNGGQEFDGSRLKQKAAPLHNLPFPSLGARFIGRDALLEAIAKEFGDSPAHPSRPQVIHGLGGVGKTRLAIEYARQYLARYSAVFFLDSSSPESLNRELAKIAGPRLLGLQLETNREPEIVDYVVGWLQRNPGWLILLNGADTSEAQQEARRVAAISGGHFLITSRLEIWPPGFTRRPVDPLSPEDAASFLCVATSEGPGLKPGASEAADRVARELGSLPLALEVAAAYMLARGLDFDRYLEDRDASREKVLVWYDENAMSYPLSVAATLSLSIDRLGPAPQALLRILSHFSPEPIETRWLEDAAQIVGIAAQLQADEMGSELSGTVDVAADIGELVKFSLVKRAGEWLSVHPLIQETNRGRIPDELREAFALAALKPATDVAMRDPDDFGNQSVWEALQPHAWRILELAIAAGCESQASVLQFQLGRFLAAKGIFEIAEQLLRRTVAIFQEQEEPIPAIVWRGLASVLDDKGQLDEAEKLYRQALEVEEAEHGSNHPGIAVSLNDLALVLLKRGNFVEAEDLLRRSLRPEIRGNEPRPIQQRMCHLALVLRGAGRNSEAEELLRQALGSDALAPGAEQNSLPILGTLAAILAETNRHAEAEPILRRALETNMRIHGPTHVSNSDILNNLATTVFSASTRYIEAEQLLTDALAIAEDFYGKSSLLAAGILSNLGNLYKTTGSFKKAERVFRELKKIHLEVLGPDHPSVALDFNNLGALMVEDGRPEEGEKLLRRALEIFERASLTEHQNFAKTLANLGAATSGLGRDREAAQILRHAAEIYERSLGPDHPDLAMCLLSLAACLSTPGDEAEEAELLLRRSLAILDRSFGRNHPTTAHCLGSLGGLLHTMGRMEEAESVLRSALEFYATPAGDRLPGAVMALTNLAYTIQANPARQSEAEEIFRRAVLLAEEILGPNHPLTARSWSGLAVSLEKSNRWDEAEQLLRRSIAVVEDLAPGSPHLATDLNNLGVLLWDSGRAKEAEKLLERACEISERSQGGDHPETKEFRERLADLRAELLRAAG